MESIEAYQSLYELTPKARNQLDSIIDKPVQDEEMLITLRDHRSTSNDLWWVLTG